jgi:hypothetical protein
VHVTSGLRALLKILLLRDVGFAADSPAECAVLHRGIQLATGAMGVGGNALLLSLARNSSRTCHNIHYT